MAPDDRFSAAYVPEEGTLLSLNGKKLGTVTGEEFSRAYFSIWVGKKTIDETFGRNLLGAP